MTDKQKDFIEESNMQDIKIRHPKYEASHCSNCGESNNEKLIHNPELPRILCIKCYTQAVRKYA